MPHPPGGELEPCLATASHAGGADWAGRSNFWLPTTQELGWSFTSCHPAGPAAVSWAHQLQNTVADVWLAELVGRPACR